MASIFDAAKIAGGNDAQELAEFEPDPGGQGPVERPVETTAADGPADSQWVVWSDAEGESAWADGELTQLTAGWLFR